MADKSVKLSTSSFRDVPICEMCLEDALKAGAAKSAQLKPTDFNATSMRFRVDGLYDWLWSFAKHYSNSSLFGVIRDLSWYWASFCATDETMTELVSEYHALLKDMTESSDFTDFVSDMREPLRVEKVGHAEYPVTVHIPFAAFGIIQECAMILGTSFPLFYQVGLAKALASDSQGRYSGWAATRFVPLFDEFMGRAKARLRRLKELRKFMEFRLREGQ